MVKRCYQEVCLVKFFPVDADKNNFKIASPAISTQATALPVHDRFPSTCNLKINSPGLRRLPESTTGRAMRLVTATSATVLPRHESRDLWRTKRGTMRPHCSFRNLRCPQGSQPLSLGTISHVRAGLPADIRVFAVQKSPPCLAEVLLEYAPLALA